MDVVFQTRKLKKLFNSENLLKKEYGTQLTKKIMVRMAMLKAAKNLADISSKPPARRHQLKGDRKEQFAVDLVHPYRLVFVSDHEQSPRKEDGGIETRMITAIRIIDVTDYH